MIVIVHDNIKVVEVFKVEEKEEIPFNKNDSITSVLIKVSLKNTDSLIIWVFEPFRKLINLDVMGQIFHHKRIMTSYAVHNEFVISDRIGYVEQTPYTNIRTEVNYPTWLMSSDIGGMYAETLNYIVATVSVNKNFDLFLSSLAKHNMPNGLLCYSNPLLIKTKNISIIRKSKNSNYILFRFVKQHYKPIWVFNLLLCFILFEKCLPILPFLLSLFFKQNKMHIDLNPLRFKSSLKVIEDKTIDVIIPTIGRKDGLYNVLKDLSKQTYLPKHVIIVEQNPLQNSKTELDYLTNESWPFKITHKFIHKTGACNARNLAFNFVMSEWVLLGDDDIRFDADLLERFFKSIESLGVKVAACMCIQPLETSSYLKTNQTDIFGSGNSIIKSNLLSKVTFDKAFEFGYGEDSDFGMQLRALGNDVLYLPEVKMTHLKLPFGGFRTKRSFSWEKDHIQPKPSPTIMIFIKKHYNVFQENGYKYVMFLKFYKEQSIRNPFRYLKQMQLQWRRSELYSEELIKKKYA